MRDIVRCCEILFDINHELSKILAKAGLRQGGDAAPTADGRSTHQPPLVQRLRGDLVPLIDEHHREVVVDEVLEGRVELRDRPLGPASCCPPPTLADVGVVRAEDLTGLGVIGGWGWEAGVGEKVTGRVRRGGIWAGEAWAWISLGSLRFHARVRSGAVVRDGTRLHPRRCPR